jgi:hypothetical protein
MSGMLNSSLVPLWTAIAAFSSIGQFVVLIVTAIFVWHYLKATQDLGKSSRDQLSESRKLVEAAQVQLEAQIQPAVDVLGVIRSPRVFARRTSVAALLSI